MTRNRPLETPQIFFAIRNFPFISKTNEDGQQSRIMSISELKIPLLLSFCQSIPHCIFLCPDKKHNTLSRSQLVRKRIKE
ncbi:hypothetical protein CEXT_189461 [Caerostris extrusa]|uniref:Uncharacterized protein n=1 Tax=Caerostris extrusa TaxID=172846 RepID=A0AAV4TQY5_CAEEX|nr:hypothetical protein CEXT_189461 [Caerostris extrusa]